MTPVTFAPMTALITFVAAPAPELVIVPVLLMLTVWRVITPVLVALSTRLPVPMIPPPNFKVLATGESVRSWLLSVTAPSKMLAALEVMVAMPELVEATEIGLANVPLRAPLRVALALPPESPMVIVPVPVAPPKDPATLPLTVPALMIRPPVKTLVPVVKVNCEVPLP